MSGLLGSGALLNWGGVLAEAEADYNAWHSLEHMPERLAVPGFLRGRRAVAVPGTPVEQKYFMMYEAVDADVFVSAPYLTRLNDPTPWTRRILSTYVQPSRTVCRVLHSRGHGVGGWLATVQLDADFRGPSQVAGGAWLDAVAALPGVLGVQTLEGDPHLGQQPTAEKRFRESRDPDRTVGLALLVDALDRACAESALAELLGAIGRQQGEGLIATVYQTQHVVIAQDVRRAGAEVAP